MAARRPPLQPLLTPFDVLAFLTTAGVKRKTIRCARRSVLFAQGKPADCVFYLQSGGVRLTVLSTAGKEAVVAMLAAGDFVGEGCLAGQLFRMASATALVPTTALRIEKSEMIRVLRGSQGFSERFLTHVLNRNIRVEEDLVDQLFNSSEKRLARALLLLARYGEKAAPIGKLPKVSQEILAEMVGTSRSRVNIFMNKFRQLGFIEYNGGLKVHSSLLSVVLHD